MALKTIFFLFYVSEIFLRLKILHIILHIKVLTVINIKPHAKSKIIVPITNGSKGVFSAIAIDTKNGSSIEIKASV